MLIIVDGVDGTGKSTLVSLLEDTLNGSGYIVDTKAEKRVPTKPKDINRVNEKTLFKNLKEMAKSDTVFIMDRGPISDLIYRVFDNYEAVTTLSKLKEFIRNNRRIFVIYCKNEKSEQLMLERGDDNPVSIQHHKELKKIYELVMAPMKQDIINFKEYNFNNKLSINEVLGTINYFCYMCSKD